METLSEWLSCELKTRGWPMAELARRSDYSDTHIGNVINGTAKATAEFCLRVAYALDTDPVEMMKKAGILKSTKPAPPSSLDDEVLANFRRLNDQQRAYIADLLSDLAGTARPEYAPAGDRSRPGQSAAGEGEQRKEQSDYGSAIGSTPERDRSDQVVRQINEDMLHDQWSIAPTVMEEGEIARVLAFLVAQYPLDREERAKENDTTHPGQE